MVWITIDVKSFDTLSATDIHISQLMCYVGLQTYICNNTPTNALGWIADIYTK
jgi:hypothetical protein